MATLITYITVFENTPLQGDGEDKLKKITAAISMAHLKLKAILCDDEYDSLVSAYNAGTMTAAQTSLYAYCVNFLVWSTYQTYLAFANYTDTDAGIRTFSENTSVESPPTSLRQLEDAAESFVAQYKSSLDTFLAINYLDYSDWYDSNCNCKKDNRVGLGITGAGRKRYRSKMFR